jgi:hypothetical protein
MSILNPGTAAGLADGVYDVQSELLLKGFLLRKEFSQVKNNQKHLKAEVGSRLINTRDSFGVCVMGGDKYKNELFLMFRGSTTSNHNADWVSNARIGVSSSKSGLPVHTGFNHIFNSMLPQIQSFLKDAKQIKSVHCIGHSLGGAVATLAADWIKSNKGVPVKLYTFGAPKPGMMLFANRLSQKLGKQNIFRAYHATDPVPMIPLFPFVQPPLPGFGHYLPSSGNIFSKQAHDIGKYVESVKDFNWSQLERIRPPYSLEHAVEQWLKSKSPVTASSPHIWQWINEAIIYVLKKISGTAAHILQSGFIGAVTLADTIAYMLLKGIELSIAFGDWVLLLIRKIMQALGIKKVETTESLDQTMMRNIMVQLMDKTNQEAKKAIQNIG